MLKARFEKFSSKEIRYRSYKDVSKNSLIRKIESDANLIQSGNLESLQTVISKSPNTKFIFQKRVSRGNSKRHVERHNLSHTEGNYDSV